MENENLKLCEHCGNQVAKTASVCPKCGGEVMQPFESYFNFFEVTVFFLVPFVGFLTYATNSPVNFIKARRALSVSFFGLIIYILIIIFIKLTNGE